MLVQKVEEKSADLAAKVAELASVTAENQDLTARVAAQVPRTLWTLTLSHRESAGLASA